MGRLAFLAARETCPHIARPFTTLDSPQPPRRVATLAYGLQAAAVIFKLPSPWRDQPMESSGAGAP